MFALRCTRRLLERLGPPAEVVPRSTTRLGDWYANLIYAQRRQLILAVSERTLLPVLLPARDARSLPARLPEAVAEVLTAIGIHAELVKEEIDQMSTVAVGRTANRQVLGSMNDLAFLAMTDLEDGVSLLDAMLHTAEAPCSPIGMESPDRATRALFLGAMQ
jgi:hypothetical protein